MDYSFKNVKLENGQTILKPILPAVYEDYAVMLYIDVRCYADLYISAIEAVLSGNIDENQISGNTGCLIVRREMSSFTSYYDEEAEECVISTEDLYKIIIDWKNALLLSQKDEK